MDFSLECGPLPCLANQVNQLGFNRLYVQVIAFCCIGVAPDIHRRSREMPTPRIAVVAVSSIGAPPYAKTITHRLPRDPDVNRPWMALNADHIQLR